MRDSGLYGFRTLDSFVKDKLTALSKTDISFSVLFEFLFREKENVMYEKSVGYRIEKTTYGQAYDETLRLALALKRELGDCGEGAVVGLHMSNSLYWIETFWALLAAGYRPLLMNLRLPADVLEQALKTTGAAAVISEGETFSVRTVIFRDIKPADAAIENPAFADRFYIMSSGTSERAKICAYTADELYCQFASSYDIIKNCRQMRKHYNGQLKLLTFLPFYHIFGLIAVYVWFAFFSRTFVHLDNMAPATIMNTVKRHRVTHIFAVPLFWEKIYEQAKAAIHAEGEKTEKQFERALKTANAIGDIPVIGALYIKTAFRPVREKLFGESICFMISGGSAIDSRVLSFFGGIGYRLANGYGTTEVGITSVEISENKKILGAGYIGAPAAGVEYKINDAGELLVRGKTTAFEIYDGQNRITGHDWYNTHDLARCVKGHYLILGRQDDLIIAKGGENINPALFEPYFKIPGVNGAALIAAEDDGTEPVLLISVKRTVSGRRFGDVDAAVRRAAGDAGLSAELQKIVYIFDPILLDNEFKVNHARLKRQYLNGELNILLPERLGGEEIADGDRQLLRVRELFAAALGEEPEAIRIDADFFLDGGGSSLDYLVMVSQLQEEFGIDFPANGEKGLNTVSGINEFIKAGSKNVD